MLGDVLAVEDEVALGIDDLALLVHDVVVLEDVLTGGEVHVLDLALRALNRLGDELGLDGHVVGHVHALHEIADAGHLVAAELAHEVVLKREVELRAARVALTAGAAAQLVVDTARLMALGADDAQAAGSADLLLLLGANLLGLGQGLGALLVGGVLGSGVDAVVAQDVERQEVGVAAQQDVGTTAGHVRGDGDGAQTTGLGDDGGLALVVLGVEDLVLDAAAGQKTGELLGALDGDGADEHRLALGMAGDDVLDHGVELDVDGAVDQVVPVVADDGPVRRDGLHRQLVDLAELGVLGKGGTGHARELLVETEVVLQRDGGQGLVLLAHKHALFGLDGLVQALGPTAAVHDTTRELVDDLDLVAVHHVVLVAVEHELGLERLLQVVHKLARHVAVDVVDAHELLDLAQALLGGRNGVLGLVQLEIDLGTQVLDGTGELGVGLGGAGAGAGDDKRGTCLVDEDGVDLVDDGEEVRALHAVLSTGDHVVAQVVEAKLGVRAVSDVGLVGLALRGRTHAVLQQAHVHAEEAVDAAHLLAIAAGQVVVDRDDVHALAGKGVEVAGEVGDERLAFAGLHLGDHAVVQGDTADDLHVEVAHAQHALGGLAHDGERLGQQVVERLAVLESLAEGGRARGELGVAHLDVGRLNLVDVSSNLLKTLELLVGAHVEKLRKKTSHNIPYSCLEPGPFQGPALRSGRSTADKTANNMQSRKDAM